MTQLKKEIRRHIRNKLAQLSEEQYVERSKMIAQKLFQQPVWMRAKCIGITISLQPEVDTYLIIEKAWEEGKTVTVPKCEPKERKMTFRAITDFKQLERVYFDLLEPIEAQTKAKKADEIDLLIVPGLAFTEQGVRLGVGGGYYDRYLAHYKGETVALAFNEQIVKTLPVDVYDQSIKRIITDELVFGQND
ncbi:5-formyltetrahydrofolate cyclo-ligase [Cytobacillus gottheilii]|uniref:5-formyltetrahydrofolate cyclo-ligase n=1 Tax=Cytobacillus gottheilii TaxID=859144 RepID=UPI0009BC0211|nr:5-formyltetrahydrofolate cyclo-ligase [Cytobacillus gottheilii]